MKNGFSKGVVTGAAPPSLFASFGSRASSDMARE